MLVCFFFLLVETTAHNPNLKSYFLADIACRKGIIFRRFSGERRQARGERGAPHTRDRRRPACLVSVCLCVWRSSLALRLLSRLPILTTLL